MGFPSASFVDSGLGVEQLTSGFSCALLLGEWVHPPTGSWMALRAWCQQGLISQPGPKFDHICCQWLGLSEDKRGLLE